MRIDRLRPTIFQVTLHAYELATLVAAARLVVQGAGGELTEEARSQLQNVLDDYEEAFRQSGMQPEAQSASADVIG
jgi:hypothetical protein